MKLTFLGATHEVTGSCFFLEACDKKIVIDCGMEQGADRFENQTLPVAPGSVDCVLLTHSHIDHSGMIPSLCKGGFSSSIHATIATTSLSSIMLKDSAHIQEFEAEWKNRKGKRSGDDIIKPMYTLEDAENAIKLFVPHPYGEKFELFPGITVRFTDAGHLLGSSSIEVWINENNVEKKIVFSGDIGNLDQPIIRDPQYIDEADYVLIESTYGNRNHSDTKPDYVNDLAEVMNKTFARGGNVVIPSFAVGRTQEMLYFIREIKNKNLVPYDYEVWVDSPLAVEATTIFKDYGYDSYDKETWDVIKSGENPITFPDLKVSVSSADSISINTNPKLKVILSASGMCEAGRIRHHLKHNLWSEKNTVLFVGYQASNTLGRKLVDGEPYVKLFNEVIAVKAEIAKLPGISGHADHDGLIKWISNFKEKPKKVFVVHGDDEVLNEFTNELKSRGYDAYGPYSGTCFNLATNEFETEATAIPIKKEIREKKSENTFARLLSAGKRLLLVIEHNKGGANKDLARFASAIESLCDKWDR